jgi:hypothetical protein
MYNVHSLCLYIFSLAVLIIPLSLTIVPAKYTVLSQAVVELLCAPNYDV